MTSRLLLSCLLLILIGMPSIAQEPSPTAAPIFPRTPESATVPHARTRASKEIAALSNSSQASGLNFAPAVLYGAGGYFTLSVAVGDVNGDGKPDIVALSGQCNSSCSNAVVGVLLGNGDGTFQAAVAYDSGGDGAYSVAIADVNGDGKPDLLVANACASGNCNNGVVGVLLGNGDGTFQAAVNYGSGGYEASAVAVADVNGDGKPDIVVANECGSINCGNPAGSNPYGSIGVLLGNGDGTFQPAVAFSSGAYVALSVAIADVNGDGNPDIVVANQCPGNPPGCGGTGGEVGVLLGNGDGTFQAAVAYNSGEGAYDSYSVAVADVNGDGEPDIVVANFCYNGRCAKGTVGVLLGNGDGTFQSAVTNTLDQSPFSVAVADVNGDGEPDIVLAHACSGSCTEGIELLLGNGDGTFQTAVHFSAGSAPHSVAIADVNGDGKPDIVVANTCANSSSPCSTNGLVAVLINTSVNATITALTTSPNPSSFGQSVTLTATVTGQPGFYKGRPTATVTFFDGATNIGSSNLGSNGMATLTASTLPVGTDSITATYNGNSNFASSTSPAVSQVVRGAIVSLSPTNLNFGNQTVGISSSPQILTLQNTGNINLTITSIQITGTNSHGFAQTNNCPASLSPNSSCTIIVTFIPGTSGTKSAAVSITDNAPNAPQSVPIAGVGVLPAATLSPTSLNFGDQGVGTTSSPQVITLTNTGIGIMNISSIEVTGTNSGDFAEINKCPSSLAPGGTCQISVKFAPKVADTRNAAVKIKDNAPGSPQSDPITGVGMPPEVTFSPAMLTFPNQVVYTTSKAQAVKLTNSGLGILDIATIAVTGPFSQTHNCGSTVKPGASCTISITFDPQTKGTLKGSISVTDNAPGGSQKVILEGTGTYIQLMPISLNFGNQPVGTKSLSKRITLSNKGSVAVNFTGVSITGTDSKDFAETNTCGKTVAAGESCFITVTFTPLADGSRTASVSIGDSGGGSPQKVSLAGTGT
jgi:hypothetical protein